MKKDEFAFNCPSLTSWKELLCCGAHRNNPKEIISARYVSWSSVGADYLVADSAVCEFKGSTEDAKEPVYKENAASLSLRECGAGSKCTGIPLLIPLFFFTSGHFVLEIFSPRIISRLCNEKQVSERRKNARSQCSFWGLKPPLALVEELFGESSFVSEPVVFVMRKEVECLYVMSNLMS